MPNHHAKGSSWQICDRRNARRRRRLLLRSWKSASCPFGDELDGTRYKVVHKLGQGVSWAVWFARDRSVCKYVTVKIKESDLSKFHNDVYIFKSLSRTTSNHPGWIYSTASLFQRHFWIDGPNGQYFTLDFHVFGPNLLRLNHWQIRLNTCFARSIVLQVTQGLEYLHSEGICHSNFASLNVFFKLINFDSWTEHKLQAQLGTPRISNIHQSFGRPSYLVDSASFFGAKPGLLTKNITIVNHSKFFFVKSPLSYVLQTINYYIAPEVLFGWGASFRLDIWALGCLIYELRAGFPLFICAINNPPLVAIEEINLVLREIPSS